MAFDFDVTGNTKLDTSGFTNGISSMTVAAGNLIADFVKSASSKMAELVTSSVDIGASFETALAKVSTIADTSKVSVGDLNKQILDTSGSMGVAAADIAEAAYQAISAGQDTANAVAFAGQASKLAAAGFTSSSSAVDILTTALNAYGLSADQATHVSDVLLTTQNLGKTSVDELSSSMGKVIPLAAAYGVTVENLSSGLAVMTANGIATAEATTYTKSMLNELGDAGSTVGKILQKQTGKSFAQLNAEGKSLGDVLQILYQSVGGSSTAFAGLWSSVEAGTGALSLASGGAEHFNDVLSQMQNSAGATETAYETMTDTFQHKVETMQTAAQNFGITLYDSLESSLSDATQWGTDCLTQLTTALSEGGPEAMLAAAGEIISDLAAGIAEQLPGLMQTGVDIITQLTQSLTDAMPAMLDTAGEVLGTLAQGIIDNLPELIVCAALIISELVNYLGDHADDIMDKGVQFVESIITGITAALPQLITSAAGLIAKWAAALIAHLPDILKCGAAMLTTLVDGIIRSIENLAEAALACIAKLVGVWDGNMDEFGHIGENIVQGIINGIAGMWGKLTSWVSGLIANLVGTASNAATTGVASGAASAVASAYNGKGMNRDQRHQDALAGKGISNKSWTERQNEAKAAAAESQKAASTISQSAGKAASAVSTSGKKASASTKAVTASVVKSISDTTTEIDGKITRTTENITETLSNGKTQQKQVITETSRQMVDGVLKDVKTITEVAADGTKTVKQTMETVRETAKTVTSTFETLADGVKTTTQTVTETLTDGTETQKQVITEVYDDVVDGALVTVEKIKTVAADGTVQVAKQIKKSSADTFDGLWKEIQTEADTGILGTFDDLYTAVKNQDWLSVGKWVANTIYGGLTANQKKQVDDFALGIVTKLNEALGGARDQLVQGAIDLGGQIVNGLTSGFSEVWQQAQGLGSTLVSVFQGLQGPLSTAALAISQGLSGGLLSSFPTIFAGVASLIGAVGAAFEGLLAAISAALSATVFGIPMGLIVAAAAVALGVAIAAIVGSMGGSKKNVSHGSGSSGGGSSGSGSMGSVDITTGTGSLEDAINANTKALEKTNSALADMIRQAGALVLSDNMRLGSTVAASGTAQVVSAANSYHREGDTNIIQNFYNGHDTAAAQQREARWEADKAKAHKR
ncbi:MAG: phage tail tape measure protein [Faecalibacterium sp.]